jgi:hypothetical protein
MTEAHFQDFSYHEKLRLFFPKHEPRRSDPYYPLFQSAKKKLRRLDVPCWRCGVHYGELTKNGRVTPSNPFGASQLEAHHADLEFSLINGVDVERWWQASKKSKEKWFLQTYSNIEGFLAVHPELDPDNHDDVFKHYMESEGNIQILCDFCHRSRDQGIHHLNYPDWRVLAIWRRNLPPHIQASK